MSTDQIPSLKLYLHPLSSYCHKALIAFYENDIPFEVRRVDDPEANAALKGKWPVGRFPALQDDARGAFVAEASIIIEYLGLHYPGPVKLIPEDPDLALQARLRDRVFDNYLHPAVQKFAADAMRPAGARDPYGVEEARRTFTTALDMVEADMATRTWAIGEAFTLADCAAAPALYYGDRLLRPFRDSHPNCAAYLDRLMARPSYARCLKEAEPFFHLLPG